MNFDVSTSVAISFLLTGVVLLGWMAWAFRAYRRTGNAQWLWLGTLMAMSLVMAGLGYWRLSR